MKSEGCQFGTTPSTLNWVAATPPEVVWWFTHTAQTGQQPRPQQVTTQPDVNKNWAATMPPVSQHV